MTMNEVLERMSEKKKKYRPQILAMVFGFVILAFLAIVLDQFLSFSAIVVFPLVVFPYFISMQMMLLQIEQREFSRRNFKSYYFAGLSPMVRKAYSPLINALLAVLIYLLSSILIFVIFYCMPSYNDVFSEMIKGMSRYSNTSDMYNYLAAFVNEHDEIFYLLFLVSNGISYGFAFMFFIYKISHNALYGLCKAGLNLPNGKNRPVFKETFVKYKKQYYLTFYKHNWYRVILVPLFYGFGVYLSTLINQTHLWMMFGSGFAIIALAILLPNLLLFQEQTYVMMFDELSKKNFKNMEKIYDNFRNNANLSEEQSKALDEFIEGLRKTIDDSQNKDKKDEPHDDEKKDS